jgi:hypothetical protein
MRMIWFVLRLDLTRTDRPNLITSTDCRCRVPLLPVAFAWVAGWYVCWGCSFVNLGSEMEQQGTRDSPGKGGDSERLSPCSLSTNVQSLLTISNQTEHESLVAGS